MLKERRKGFALAYAMLFSVSFLLFFFAWAVSSKDTLEAVSYNEQRLRSAALAELGTEVAFHLLRSQGQDWIGDEDFSFSNQEGASDYFQGVGDADFRARYSERNLSGNFRVTFTSLNDTDAEGVAVPEGGSYLLIESTGQVGGSAASSRSTSQMLVKMGSPFVNNVICLAAGGFLGPGREAHGPIFIDDSTAAPGHIELIAHQSGPREGFPGQYVTRATTTTVSGQIRACDRICASNVVNNGTTVDWQDKVPIPAGLHPAGFEFTIPAPALPGDSYADGIGGVRFSEETLIEPYVRLGLEPSLPAVIFSKIQSVANRQELDVTAYPDGVLVEIEDSQVKVYTAVRERIGRVYDLSLLVTHWEQAHPFHTQTVLDYQAQFGGEAPGLRAAIAEANWDDPAFPKETMPASLRNRMLDYLRARDPGVTLGEIPLEGNYFDQHKIVPGALLATYPLTRSQWTSVALRATRLSSSTEDGQDIAPSVFVRGRVQGKLALSYEVPGSLAAGRDHFALRRLADIVVLPEASPSGVPGGLTLADPRPMVNFGQTSSVSEDMIALISRGRITSAGPASFYLGWVAAAANPETRLDLQAVSRAGLSDDEFTLSVAGGCTPCRFDAASVGAVAGYYPIGRYTANMRVIDSVGGFESRSPACLVPLSTSGGDPPSWSSITGSPPVTGSAPAVLPFHFRQAYQIGGPYWFSNGAFGAFHEHENGASPAGKMQYDYRWRQLDAKTLRENIGLPVQPLLIYRRPL